jgi:hypothetical protein
MWCEYCKSDKQDFGKDKRNKNGLTNKCKECSNRSSCYKRKKFKWIKNIRDVMGKI